MLAVLHVHVSALENSIWTESRSPWLLTTMLTIAALYHDVSGEWLPRKSFSSIGFNTLDLQSTVDETSFH